MTNFLLILQLASTWFMVGLIWMVQIVHYPMFDRVGVEQFVRYEADHTRLITPVVGVPMLIELGSAIGLLLVCWQNPQQRALLGAALMMLLAIWLTTAFWSVPCHSKLASGYDAVSHRSLVMSNWVRTILWTGRGLVLGWLVLQALSISPLDRNLLSE